MKPIYEMAVMNVRLKFRKAQDARLESGDARFRESLRDALWNQYVEWARPEEMADCIEMFEEYWQHDWKPRFIPDLWSIDRDGQTIHLFEIEDTHPLTQSKLCLLHDWWWHMDSLDWQVTLTVFDRYGLNPRPLNLTEYAFHMLPVLLREEEET